MWELDCEESWVPKNWWFWTVVLEKTLESPLDCKEIQPVHSKDHPGRSLEGMMLKLKLQYFGHLMRRVAHWKRFWCWEGFGAGEEGDDGGWDGWMASPTRWTRVWVNSGSWWWTRRPGVLQFMGSQRVRHYWETELNWTLMTQMVKNLPGMWGIWVQSLVGKIPRRRASQPTPVFLSGESHGQKSLAGYSPWDHKKSDMAEQLTLSLFIFYSVLGTGLGTGNWEVNITRLT